MFCLFKVAYAQKDLKADIIVDMATLTGAQGIATGKFIDFDLKYIRKYEDSICYVPTVRAGGI